MKRILFLLTLLLAPVHAHAVYYYHCLTPACSQRVPIDIQNYTPSSNTTASGAVTLNSATSANWDVTLTGNVTDLQVSNLKSGQALNIIFTQDATGGRTVAWHSGYSVSSFAVLSDPNSVTRVLVYNDAGTMRVLSYDTGRNAAMDGAKLDKLPDATFRDVAENGATNSPPMPVINFIGPVVSNNSSTMSKDVYPFQFSSNTGDFTMANSASAQAWLAAANDTLTAEANTTYFFDAVIEIEGMGGTTRTTAFVLGGGATYTAVQYYSQLHSGVANAAVTTVVLKYSTGATANILNPTNASAATTIHIKGIIRTNAAGTIIPQIQFSADPTGTILCKAGSYIRLIRAGSDTNASAGSWN